MRFISLQSANAYVQLVCKQVLITHFAMIGLRVSTIKHAHHDFDIDQKGKDSYRHRVAGAHEVIVASGARWALLHELHEEDEPDLDVLLAKLATVDLVIVEGFKRHIHPKIEVILDDSATPMFLEPAQNIIAVASKNSTLQTSLPLLSLDEPESVGRFIVDYFDAASISNGDM